MGREPTQKPDDAFATDGTVEAVDEDFSEIDPAEFFDPEEFGIKQRP